MAIDRHVLDSNLIAGGALVIRSALLGAWPLSLIAAVYVAGVSTFFAVSYGRQSLSIKHELLTWVGPWLLAIALWAVILGAIDGPSSLLMSLWAGAIVGTGCYVVWQTIALVVRRVISAGGRSVSLAG